MLCDKVLRCESDYADIVICGVERGCDGIAAEKVDGVHWVAYLFQSLSRFAGNFKESMGNRQGIIQ